MDVLTKDQRHKNMQNIHSSDTTIEVTLRRALWSKGIRFRVNRKDITGKPDISIKKYKLAVFCDGDFWHGNCSDRSIGTNTKFWEQKIKRNRERDLEQTIKLRDEGWTVLRFWGSDINNDPDGVAYKILKEIERVKQQKETRRLMKEQFAAVFAKQLVSYEYSILRVGRNNCPEKNTYDLYAVCFFQTVCEMKEQGYKIPKAYKMPRLAIKRAKAVLKRLTDV